MGFTRLHRVLVGFTGFYWVLMGFTGFYWVPVGFTRLHRVLVGFTGFPRNRKGMERLRERFDLFIFDERSISILFPLSPVMKWSGCVDLFFSLFFFAKKKKKKKEGK